MNQPTHVRLRVLGLIMATSAVGYVLRTNLSIAGPFIKSELGLSETQLGLVLSAFVTAYAVGQIPGGLVGERLGPRRVMTSLLPGWAAVTLLTGLLPNQTAFPTGLTLGLLLVLRGAMGALQAPVFPVMSGGTVRAWLPSRQWALASAAQNTSFTLASAGAAPVFVWLVLRLGWRMAFITGAPLAAGLAAWWWWDTRDNPADHPRVNDAEVELIRIGTPKVLDSSGAGWAAVVMNRDILLLTLSYFCINYVFYLFFNWFYYYLTEVRHLSAEMAGYFTAVQWIVGTVASLAGGLICDWLSMRLGATRGCRLTAMAGILFAAPCLVLGAVVSNPVWMVTLLSISFGSTQLVDSAYWVAAMRVAGPRAPLSTGILNTGGNLSGSLAAILVPIAAGTWGWAAGIGSGVLFAVIAAFMWVGIRADRQIEALRDRSQSDPQRTLGNADRQAGG
jgi:MFS transporter, ACS family, glucarate transporter